VLNTPHGTVQGEIEGTGESVESVKHWLANVGSSKSRIDNCEFAEETTTNSKLFGDFEIIRNKSEIVKKLFKIK